MDKIKKKPSVSKSRQTQPEEKKILRTPKDDIKFILQVKKQGKYFVLTNSKEIDGSKIKSTNYDLPP